MKSAWLVIGGLFALLLSTFADAVGSDLGEYPLYAVVIVLILRDWLSDRRAKHNRLVSRVHRLEVAMRELSGDKCVSIHRDAVQPTSRPVA